MEGDFSLFVNSYKQSEKQPDLSGTISIPMDMLEDAASNPLCIEERNGITYLKLRTAAWEQVQGGGNKPVLKGKISQFKPKTSDAPPSTPSAFNTQGRRKLT